MARNDDLGARVRAARSYADLSQQGLADAIGVERRIVGYIEANEERHELTVPEAQAIARATHVPVGFLVHGWDEPPDLIERVDALEAEAKQTRTERDALRRTLRAIGTLLRDRLALSVNEALELGLAPADEEDLPLGGDRPAP